MKTFTQKDIRPIRRITVADNNFGKIDRIVLAVTTLGITELIHFHFTKEWEKYYDQLHPEYRHKVKLVHPRKLVIIPSHQADENFLIKSKCYSEEHSSKQYYNV